MRLEEHCQGERDLGSPHHANFDAAGSVTGLVRNPGFRVPPVFADRDVARQHVVAPLCPHDADDLAARLGRQHLVAVDPSHQRAQVVGGADRLFHSRRIRAARQAVKNIRGRQSP